jgi:hypothetical protein
MVPGSTSAFTNNLENKMKNALVNRNIGKGKAIPVTGSEGP